MAGSLGTGNLGTQTLVAVIDSQGIEPIGNIDTTYGAMANTPMGSNKVHIPMAGDGPSQNQWVMQKGESWPSSERYKRNQLFSKSIYWFSTKNNWCW